MGDLWDAISGKQAEEGAVADARLKRLNDQKLERGQWNREQYEMAENHRLTGQILDPVSEVIEAAKEGAAEGLDVVAGSISDAVNGTAKAAGKFAFKALPGWLIAGLVIGGLIYVAMWLGWGKILLGKLKR